MNPMKKAGIPVDPFALDEAGGTSQLASLSKVGGSMDALRNVAQGVDPETAKKLAAAAAGGGGAGDLLNAAGGASGLMNMAGGAGGLMAMAGGAAGAGDLAKLAGGAAGGDMDSLMAMASGKIGKKIF